MALLHPSSRDIHSTTSSRKSATFETEVEAVPIGGSPTIERARKDSKILQLSEAINEKAPVASYTPLVVALVLLVITFLWSSFTFLRVPLIQDRKGSQAHLIFLVLISVSTAMLLISYLRTMFTSSYVNDYDTPIECMDLDFPKCQWCNALKPDRTHHCSICDRCVLKMDHHCPFVANCVGFYNYKYFMLFLFWVNIGVIVIIVGGVYEGSGTLASNSSGWREIVLLVAFWLTVVIGCIVMVFFFFHVHLVLVGQTTLEFVVGIELRIQKGPWYNFTQVFGKNPLFWLIPIKSTNTTAFDYDPLLKNFASSNDDSTSVATISTDSTFSSKDIKLQSPRGDL